MHNQLAIALKNQVVKNKTLINIPSSYHDHFLPALPISNKKDKEKSKTKKPVCSRGEKFFSLFVLRIEKTKSRDFSFFCTSLGFRRGFRCYFSVFLFVASYFFSFALRKRKPTKVARCDFISSDVT